MRWDKIRYCRIEYIDRDNVGVRNNNWVSWALPYNIIFLFENNDKSNILGAHYCDSNNVVQQQNIKSSVVYIIVWLLAYLLDIRKNIIINRSYGGHVCKNNNFIVTLKIIKIMILIFVFIIFITLLNCGISLFSTDRYYHTIVS